MLFASLLTPAQRSALAEAFGDLDRRDRVLERAPRVAAQAAWIADALTDAECIYLHAEAVHLNNLTDMMGAR